MALPVFDAALERAGLFPLHAVRVDTLQVNVGKRCNQACKHCHVDAGPNRTEEMTRETAEHVVAALERNPGIRTLDITGGAPELNANFRYLVRSAREMGRHVIDRCNLSSHAKESRYFVPTCARISVTLWQSVSKFW